MSEGALNFSSILSTAGPEPFREKKVRKREAELDLPSLMQQVSLKSRRDSGGVFSDDMATVRKGGRRRVNLFSSLRLRKREASDSEGKDPEVQKEIRMILTNLRNKGKLFEVL